MRLVIGVVVAQLALLGLVYAQQAKPQPLKEYTLKLTGDDVDLIGEGLGSMPFAKVINTMSRIQQQVIDQQKASVKEPEKK